MWSVLFVFETALPKPEALECWGFASPMPTETRRLFMMESLLDSDKASGVEAPEPQTAHDHALVKSFQIQNGQ